MVLKEANAGRPASHAVSNFKRVSDPLWKVAEAHEALKDRHYCKLCNGASCRFFTNVENQTDGEGLSMFVVSMAEV